MPRLAAASALALMITALVATVLLSTAVLTAPPAAAATGTYVRLAQLTPDMAGSDLVLSSASDPQRSVRIPGLTYGGMSEYRLIQPGDYVVGISAEGSPATPSVSLTLNAMEGTAYTVAAVGKANTAGLAVLTDDLTPPGPGNAKVRVINAAPTAPTLDVRGSGGDLARGLAYATAGEYRTVPAGTSTLTVGAPGAAGAELPITVAANQVASVVLTDSGGSLAAQVRVDAEGPAEMPPGAIRAGYGGADPAAGGASTGAVVFGALALAAAAVSVRLSRRTRSARTRA